MAKAQANLRDYDRPSVTVDLVLLSVIHGVLSVLVMRRADAPYRGSWALPGGFVRIDEPLQATVARLLRDKALVPGAFVEQLYSFGDLGRDPRGRVITIAYYALVPAEDLGAALATDEDLKLAAIEVPWSGEAGGPVSLVAGDGTALSLAFDHGEILGMAVKRLRGKLGYSTVGLELLPDRFTLRQLQEIHEAILNQRLTKPAFRRKMLDRGFIEPTGEREKGTAFRPAELYRRTADPS